MTLADDATTRFSRRVNDYVKYRPGYPDELASVLRRRVAYQEQSVIADVGSGTGISTRFFLDRGNLVYAVEPNQDMRSAAEEWLGSYSRFRSIAARAEATTLADSSVDLVVAAQAFHWFDAEAARREFLRILRPGGHVVIFWNERKSDASPLLEGYEALLLEHSQDYARVAVRYALAEKRMAHFFGSDRWGTEALPNQQQLDLDGLIGRALSSSYVPLANQPNHQAFLDGLRALFAEHAVNGRVNFEYATRVFWGRLAAQP